MLGWWRWHHNTWLTTIYTAVIGVLVLAVAMLLLMRAKTDADRRVADIMLMSAIMPVTVAAAGPARPGGLPQAVLGFGVLTVAAALALRFTGRRLGFTPQSSSSMR